MKNFVKMIFNYLSIVVFVLAAVAAFAFNSPEEATTTWFPVDENGLIDVDNPINNPGCAVEDMVYCAVEFDNGDLDDGKAPIDDVTEPGAEEEYLQVTFRAEP